ncbi:P-loop containing nucleoside triphosphate hydrolase protein [Zopfia rhizophila CBS 207.26]|uniref:P-loop containing nucleoside triphosphate hydrolase protein n=1 Tax=Zopfia rhizophila CBS 207.26 TaxID=1314779 RepID=A0A6A6DHQ5_9PEZI|nr:P-loop containing nucleoside triphosphate hydrolase protein [Zopfia rhizophila CBS 207.26]
MNLLLRQIWALIRKNLLIICVRRPISTLIRAIIIPLAVVLIVGYSREFFSSPQRWGTSSPHRIRSLEEGLSASSRHDIVGFVDNGMKGGAVSSVINSLSQTIRKAGKTPRVFKDTNELAQTCASDTNGRSPCYGGIVFYSSPNEGANGSAKGIWNYTLRGDKYADIGFVDVTKDNNGPEVYLLPLQRAVDMEIISRSMSDNTSTLPSTINDILYTWRDEASRLKESNDNYLGFAIYVFGVVFSFTMINLVYHMTAFIAAERELGIASLIDTMIPGGSAFRARFVRLLSTYISFTAVYLPSWLAVGIVMSVVIFPKTSSGIPVGYHIFSGLAFCSFSLFGSAFFKKAQLSGSIMTIITMIFAILPQVLFEQTQIQVAIFSLLFPSANYTYFVTGVARWEAADLKINLTGHTPDDEAWRVKLYLHWVFLILQIFTYPVLAFFLEHILFGAASPGRGFAQPADSQAPTVTLSNFCKTYKPGILKRIFKGGKEVHAVVDMNLNAFRGQILCLLGPNGSGKSTTLNCIAGEQKVTSGNIIIDPTGGLGYAPQANVLWDDLTVEEHVRIFSDLKCTARVNEEVVTELVKACDLEKKLPFRAKTLSGGQKRKLQLAMMFAGGSAVCCVDEVSTGLDPISRRRIWEILLAERGKRSIIMTTHFLDEADFLADNIAIMFKGPLKAEGTAATLKNRFGNGYTVKLPHNVDLDIPLSGPVEKEASRHQMVYRVATATLAAELIEHLEREQIRDYQVSGPTMEELFLKVTGDTIHSDHDSSSAHDSGDANGRPMVVNTGSGYKLTDGRPLSAFKQWWILFCKRFQILRRRYMPYFFTIAIAIAGAGVAQLLIKSYKDPMECLKPADLIQESNSRYDLGNTYRATYVFGPADKLDDRKLATIADMYSVNHTRYEFYGFHNVSEVKDQLTLVNTFEEFTKYCKDNSYTLNGGLWVADPPTIAFEATNAADGASIQNFLNYFLSGVPISTGFSMFASSQMPDVFNAEALEFMIYFGLILACYPAFFALYPTNERISNVRSMEYSNGVCPLPLWLSHLCFDGIVILIISIVGTALLSIATPVWYGLPLLFVVMFLYGITSTLLSYIISMFARSAVAAWAFAAIGQTIFYFAYFGGLIGVQTSTPYGDMEAMNNKLYFGLSIISPAVSMERALSIGLGQFALLCNGNTAGSLGLYGGPILYLILQAAVLFTLLLWWDSSFTLPSFLHRNHNAADTESTEMYSSDLMAELQRIKSGSTDLRVESVTKSFGKNLAVDNVTFGVQTSEIFALLGPNGAGKSTIISMIRGDIKPSTAVSILEVADHSVLSSPIATRANLGVCPQFDAADVLTVTETLRFFAKVRGVKDICHNVATVISACGLENWAHQLAQKLSGGTKRKLSLAIALIGNPRVLVLDEPSSALDANAKRNMWKCLQSVGKGRAVVLTTHSMEEADALADRIGIVSSRMLAVGAREALKKRAGDAFYIHLVSRTAPRTSDAELQVMKDWVAQAFDDARIERETQGGQVRFEVSAEDVELVDLIRTLEASKGDLGVEFYSVGKATLDEVFENIVKRYGDGYCET